MQQLENVLQQGTKSIKVSLNIADSGDNVIERFIFSVDECELTPTTLQDLHENLQSLLLKMSTVDATLTPLPAGKWISSHSSLSCQANIRMRILC